jgi:hypothetical protein
MVKLSYTESTVRLTTANDIDDFISLVYGRPFNCRADSESGNDVWQKYIVNGIVFKHEKEQIDMWNKDDWGLYLLSSLLNDCAARNLLPHGIYFVDMSW